MNECTFKMKMYLKTKSEMQDALIMLDDIDGMWGLTVVDDGETNPYHEFYKDGFKYYMILEGYTRWGLSNLREHKVYFTLKDLFHLSFFLRRRSYFKSFMSLDKVSKMLGTWIEIYTEEPSHHLAEHVIFCSGRILEDEHRCDLHYYYKHQYSDRDDLCEKTGLNLTRQEYEEEDVFKKGGYDIDHFHI